MRGAQRQSLTQTEISAGLCETMQDHAQSADQRTDVKKVNHSLPVILVLK